MIGRIRGFLNEDSFEIPETVITIFAEQRVYTETYRTHIEAKAGTDYARVCARLAVEDFRALQQPNRAK